MKKLVYVLIFVVFSTQITFAGGIMTNTNQSAAWVRMLVRDASLGMDAVYYNPAGLTFLEDGFFLSLNNQTLVQNRLVTSNYPYLIYDTEWEGKVSAPLFPGVYTGYKMGKLVISLGVNPIGGGGSATYDAGLPSFEYSVADLQESFPITQYNLDAFFEGSSVFWGIQLGASYAINDMFSVYLGGRFVTAQTTYIGHLKDIQANFDGTNLSSVSEYLNGLATMLEPAATNTTTMVLGGLGALTLAQVEAAGVITAADRASLEGGLMTLGYTAEQISALDVQTINAVYLGAYESADHGSALTADQEGDVVQKGNGFTPIIGFNLKPNDKLNIGFKYEFKTELELENETVVGKEILTGFNDAGDPVYMFPNGAKTRQDMPAMLSLGVEYKATDKFSTQVGFHYYFDKSADYGKTKAISLGSAVTEHVDNADIIDKNLIEYAIGFEYKINEKLLASVGYLGTKTGVSDEYHSDLSYSNSSNTFGGGIQYSLNENLAFNIGFASTSYVDSEKTFDRIDPASVDPTNPSTIQIKETYDKDNIFLGIGVDFKF